MVTGCRHEWTNEAVACATNESEGRYTCTPPGTTTATSIDVCMAWCAEPQLPIPMQQVLGGPEEGNPGAVDRFGNWDQAEGWVAASLILCILHVLHVNTSVLPSSCSVAGYNSNVMANPKKQFPCFCFRPLCTETDRQ